MIISQINNAAASQNCQYPEHSVPTCDGDGDCAFTCTHGFTLTNSNPPTCACPPPSVVCNGQCQGPGACPSANARVDKRKRWVGSGSCIEKGPGWAACGVYGGGHRAWECVNIDRDLESCKCLSHRPLTHRVFSFVKLTTLFLFPC